MHSDYAFTNTKPDQQVPGSQATDISGDPRVPLLEEILTHEQNTCIEIRDTCTIMAQSVRDVLGSACPKGGYVQTMKDRLGQLEKAVTTLESTIKRKSMFSGEFLDSASQRWFEKRLSSTSRKRRLRNFKRKSSPGHTPTSTPSTPTQYTFLPYDDSRYDSTSPSSPGSPPQSPPSLHLSIPSSDSPPMHCATPSTPSFPSSTPTQLQHSSSSCRVPSTPASSSSLTTPSPRNVPTTPSFTQSTQCHVPSVSSHALPSPRLSYASGLRMPHEYDVIPRCNSDLNNAGKVQNMSIANIIN